MEQNIHPQHLRLAAIAEEAIGNICIGGASKNALEFMASADAEGYKEHKALLLKYFPVKTRLMILRANWRTIVATIRYVKQWNFMYKGRGKELAEQATAQACYETASWIDDECRRMVESLSPANKEKFEAEFEALAA